MTNDEHKYPDIWNDDPEQIAAFNREIGSQDDGADYGREAADVMDEQITDKN